MCGVMRAPVSRIGRATPARNRNAERWVEVQVFYDHVTVFYARVGAPWANNDQKPAVRYAHTRYDCDPGRPGVWELCCEVTIEKNLLQS